MIIPFEVEELSLVIEKLISKANEIYYNKYLILVNGFYSRVNNKITFRYSGRPTFTYKI